MKRAITIFITLVCVMVVAYLAFFAVLSLRQGYSWQEMDWHQRGTTSISDFFGASDIGKREVVQDGRKCTEYFAYKDGLPVKTVCPK